ncbi:hypothetical protein D9M71_555260 [compost metagenome]
MSRESRAPTSSKMVVSIQAADSRRRRPWASNRHNTPIRLAPKCEASTRRCGIRKPICSRRVSISGVAPENSKTTPDRNTSSANIGAAKPEAARRVWRVWNKRWPSLISRNRQATSIGSTT